MFTELLLFSELSRLVILNGGEAAMRDRTAIVICSAAEGIKQAGREL